MCNSMSSLVIFTANRISTYLFAQVGMWLNIQYIEISFYTDSVVSVLYGAAVWHENLVIPSGLTFKSQHCCYETAWVIQQYLAGFGDDVNGYFWVGFWTSVSHHASSRAHGAHRIPSRLMTVIFIRVHIIHAGTLWSAVELSVHKTAQERKLEESDNAACTKTAQMTGGDKGRKKRRGNDFVLDGFNDDLKGTSPLRHLTISSPISQTYCTTWAISVKSVLVWLSTVGSASWQCVYTRFSLILTGVTCKKRSTKCHMCWCSFILSLMKGQFAQIRVYLFCRTVVETRVPARFDHFHDFMCDFFCFL